MESVGIGVTSSILPIFIPKRANALNAAYAPGPGYLVSTPKIILREKLINQKYTSSCSKFNM